MMILSAEDNGAASTKFRGEKKQTKNFMPS